jgi:hypothetical protein
MEVSELGIRRWHTVYTSFKEAAPNQVIVNKI